MSNTGQRRPSQQGLGPTWCLSLCPWFGLPACSAVTSSYLMLMESTNLTPLSGSKLDIYPWAYFSPCVSSWSCFVASCTGATLVLYLPGILLCTEFIYRMWLVLSVVVVYPSPYMTSPSLPSNRWGGGSLFGR